MLNRMDAKLRHDMLNEIGQTDAAMLNHIRDLMFVFEDLLSVDRTGMRLIVAGTDSRTAAIALKGSSEKLRKHFMGSMSTSGAQMMQEDIDSLGPVKLKDVEAAQQQILAYARELEANGSLALTDSGDEYVV
jgi:flagellar motor switch protein FliG